jgi:hypothetical protein
MEQYGEYPDRSWTREGLEGWSGHREFFVPYQDRLKTPIPARGDEFPGHPGLFCVSREFKGSGAAQPNVTDPEDGQPCQYSYCDVSVDYAEMPKLETELVWRGSGSMETLTTGLGKIWKSDGSPVGKPFTVPFSQWAMSCTRVTATPPWDTCMNYANCINQRSWQPTIDSPRFGPETLYFSHPEVEQWKDPERSKVLKRSVFLYRVSYIFVWRSCSHNLAPREDENGFGWDMPLPRNYRLTDFNPMLGLPPMGYVFDANTSSQDGIGGGHVL